MIKKVIDILHALVEMLGRFRKARAREEYQAEYSQIESSPADWMREHFNDGVQRDTSVPGDAGQTGEAKPAKHDQNRERGHQD